MTPVRVGARLSLRTIVRGQSGTYARNERKRMSAKPIANSNDSNTAIEPRGAKSLMVVLSFVLVLVFVAAAVPAPIRAAWDEFSLRMQLPSSEPQSASPSKLSDHEIEEIANLPAQQQAERLLEGAINHSDGAT